MRLLWVLRCCWCWWRRAASPTRWRSSTGPRATRGADLDSGPGNVDTLNPTTEGGSGDRTVFYDKCVSVAGGEVCNGLDDDCNGKVDDVDPTRLATDAKNCGKCGNVCSFPNALAKCQNGTCVLDSCAPGYYDIDKDPNDGCEYACLQTNKGMELCDGVDNDCDGKVDNGFDTSKDLNNCGTCGTICQR